MVIISELVCDCCENHIRWLKTYQILESSDWNIDCLDHLRFDYFDAPDLLVFLFIPTSASNCFYQPANIRQPEQHL